MIKFEVIPKSMAAAEMQLKKETLGLGHALVLAGKLAQKAAGYFRKAQTGRTSFIAELTGSGAGVRIRSGARCRLPFAAPLRLDGCTAPTQGIAGSENLPDLSDRGAQ
jgi:hypothetical protein